MKYVVFEAGSRCGTSARYFFRKFVEKYGAVHQLVLVDADLHFIESALYDMQEYEDVYSEEVFYNYFLKENGTDDILIYPADELTRQRGFNINPQPFNAVFDYYYNKSRLNQILRHRNINVPLTLDCNNVIVKPNSHSAGSKGIMKFDNVCVSARIDIDKEYVVDVFRYNGVEAYYPREVCLRGGYDEYIKFLPQDHEVVAFAKKVADAIPDMYTGVSHMQLMQDAEGKLYYIEGSKRQSGTSMVNALFGYNPFELLHTGNKRPYESDKVFLDTWYKYDYLRLLIEKVSL